MELHSFPTRRSSDLFNSLPVGIRRRHKSSDRDGSHRDGSVFVSARGTENSSCEYYGDRKSTRLNSSHITISYAVFYLKKKRWNLQCQLLQNSPNRQ